MRQPKLSVIMPVYNAERFLPEAIESILGQTFGDFEFLIFDDCSTDGSLAVARSYAGKDPRIQVFASERNLGYIPHLNRGIEMARGAYLARMDADDVSLRDRFEKQVRYLDAHPSVAAAGGSITSVNESGVKGGRSVTRASIQEIKVHFLFTNYLFHPTVMMRKSMVPAEGYRADYMPAEDFDLWTRMLEKHDLFSLPDTVLLYRIHSHNTSTKNLAALMRNASRVLRSELVRLGLSPTDEEVELHHDISDMRLDGISLEQIESWFLKLWKAGHKSGLFDAHILLSTVLGRHFLALRRVKGASRARKARSLTMMLASGFGALSWRDRALFACLSVKRALRYARITPIHN